MKINENDSKSFKILNKILWKNEINFEADFTPHFYSSWSGFGFSFDLHNIHIDLSCLLHIIMLLRDILEPFNPFFLSVWSIKRAYYYQNRYKNIHRRTEQDSISKRTWPITLFYSFASCWPSWSWSSSSSSSTLTSFY